MQRSEFAGFLGKLPHRIRGVAAERGNSSVMRMRFIQVSVQQEFLREDALAAVNPDQPDFRNHTVRSALFQDPLQPLHGANTGFTDHFRQPVTQRRPSSSP
jgi:hypothetical protein